MKKVLTAWNSEEWQNFFITFEIVSDFFPFMFLLWKSTLIEVFMIILMFEFSSYLITLKINEINKTPSS